MPTAQREISQWRIGRARSLPLDQPRIVGVLNVTPDSFSDGGNHSTHQSAIDAALQMKDRGACMIDVGGESTRPGAQPVSAAEQIRRTIPVIEGVRRIASAGELLISIDTTSAEVARAALDAGADVINDISAGRDDEHMLPLAAARGCGLVLMHRRTAPQRDSYSDQYSIAPDYGGDVVEFVKNFLRERRDAAIAAGVNPDAIVLDPGLGFGKSLSQNYEIIRRVRELFSLNCPVLSAASRKSFIGAITGVPEPAHRVMGSVAVSVAQYLQGVRLFRVHDVAPHREALAVAAAIV
jgi:dihydropteroate synthase